MTKKEMREKIARLENGIEKLEIINRNLENNLQKIENGECIITDHCSNCKYASVKKGYYSWHNCKEDLITCDLHHICPNYERKDDPSTGY